MTVKCKYELLTKATATDNIYMEGDIDGLIEMDHYKVECLSTCNTCGGYIENWQKGNITPLCDKDFGR